MQKQTNDVDTLAHIQMMRAYHRVTYMGERQTYWDRRRQAVVRPKHYISMITDGMQQGHTHVPQYGSTNTQLVNAPLKVSLQGTLLHGMNVFLIHRFVACSLLCAIHASLMPHCYVQLLGYYWQGHEYGYLLRFTVVGVPHGEQRRRFAAGLLLAD